MQRVTRSTGVERGVTGDGFALEHDSERGGGNGKSTREYRVHHRREKPLPRIRFFGSMEMILSTIVKLIELRPIKNFK